MLKDKVMVSVKEAMKDKDTLRKGVLVTLRSELLKKEKLKGAELNEVEENDVVQSELKKVKESMDFAIKADRKDLYEQDNIKHTILIDYLTLPIMESAEMDDYIKELYHELLDEGKQVTNVGMLMGVFMKKYRGKYSVDGNQVKKVAEELIKGNNVAKSMREKNHHIEELFEDHVSSESDKVDFYWGKPKGHEMF